MEETKKNALSNASIAPEDFNWDAFEGNSELYGGANEEEIRAA